MARAARRPKTANILVWILIGLLVVSLMGFGIVSFTGAAGSVGTVGKEKISVNAYYRAVRDRINQALQAGARDVPVTEISQLTLHALATEAAIDNEAKSIGLSVDDKTVLDALRTNDAFLGLDGNFDRGMYERTLQSMGMTAAEFDEELREARARQIILTSIASGLQPDPVYSESIIGYNFESRDVRWIEVDDLFLSSEEPQPTDAELRAFYNEKKQLFTLPERRRITYAYLEPDMVADTTTVTDQQVRDLYDSRIDNYVKPERRILERLVFPTHDEAAIARNRLDSNEADFDMLLQEAQILPQDAYVGEVAREDLDEQAASAVFGISEPGIVGPVQSAFGPAVYRVIAILQARHDSLEDVQAELEKELALRQATARISTDAEAFNDLLAGGATLEQLVAETPMRLATVDFDEMASGPVLSDAAFRRFANSVTEEHFPELHFLAGGGVFALRLDRIVPPQLQDFSAVEDEVSLAWSSERKRQEKLSIAEAHKSSLEAGSEFLEAGLPGASLAASLVRGSAIEGAPAGIVEMAFTLQPGMVGVVESEDRVALFKLEAIHDADTADDGTQSISRFVNEQFSQTAGQDAASIFALQLLTEAGLSVDQATVNSVLSQLQ